MSVPIRFLRHGPTQWNAEQRLQGHRDVSLSNEGTAEVLRWRLPPLPGACDVRVSPLRRAIETATLLDLPARIDERLIEMAWGDWEGQRLEELRAAHPEATAAVEGAGLDLAAPGGGESPRQVQQRLRPLLVELAAAGRPALLVAHKGVMRAALALATGWDMTGKPPVKLPRAAFLELRLAADGTPLPDVAVVPLERRA